MFKCLENSFKKYEEHVIYIIRSVGVNVTVKNVTLNNLCFLDNLYNYRQDYLIKGRK